MVGDVGVVHIYTIYDEYDYVVLAGRRKKTYKNRNFITQKFSYITKQLISNNNYNNNDDDDKTDWINYFFFNLNIRLSIIAIHNEKETIN